MANVNKMDQAAVRKENIEATVSATDKFFTENKKTIITAVAAVVVVFAAVLAYSKFVYQPKCQEAMAQTYKAELAFQNGDFELALNGDGDILGFADVINNYGSKSGKAVYMYAGICEMQLGNFESALSYLKNYKGKDSILAARALALQGDANVELEQYEKAVSFYESAASKADNMFAATYLLKAGNVYEVLANKEKALACYKTIKDKYAQSYEAYEIDKYITRVSE